MAKRKRRKTNFSFIDLFAGAGGLSEGFVQAGFEPVAHVEMDLLAAQTLETRTAYHYLKDVGQLNYYWEYLKGKINREEFIGHVPKDSLDKVICETMSETTLKGLFERIDQRLKHEKIDKVDVVIGGPPCQAYSLVGRAQNSHMGTPMEEDPRNELYKLYARFLKKYHPQMFVFENVLGIKSANGGRTWKNIQALLKTVGYEIECHELNAKDFGVLQNRRRMIIIGWLKGSNMQYPAFKKVTSSAIVNDILSDLPKLRPGKRAGIKYGTGKISDYLRENGLRSEDDVLTLHESRPNQERDVEIYKTTIKLWNNGNKRLNYNN